jgi:hypothetical protein
VEDALAARNHEVPPDDDEVAEGHDGEDCPELVG